MFVDNQDVFINVNRAERNIFGSFDVGLWGRDNDPDAFAANDNVPWTDLGTIDKDLPLLDELGQPRTRQVGLCLCECGIKPKSPKAFIEA